MGSLQLDVRGVIVVTRIRGFAHVRILETPAILGSIMGKVAHVAGGISEECILLTTGTTKMWPGGRQVGRERESELHSKQAIHTTDDCTCMAMACD